jgi:hypothetical protein
MSESLCDDRDWATDWLEEQGYIDAMLDGGWNLETVQDIPKNDIAEAAKEMAAALRKSELMLEVLGEQAAQLSPWIPLRPTALHSPSHYP